MKISLIFLAWFFYCALHSLLADARVKCWFGRRWPGAAPYCRLAFNFQATVLLLPILWLAYSAEGAWLWRWLGVWGWLANGLGLLTIAGMAMSSRSYDMDEFFGLRQLKEGYGDDRQEFVLSRLHRFVRHPRYSLGLLILWTRDMNAPLLVSALAITIYLIVGSKREERALVERYGDTYRAYMEKVPGLIPVPWKFLTADEAAALTRRPD